MRSNRKIRSALVLMMLCCVMLTLASCNNAVTSKMMIKDLFVYNTKQFIANPSNSGDSVTINLLIIDNANLAREYSEGYSCSLTDEDGNEAKAQTFSFALASQSEAYPLTALRLQSAENTYSTYVLTLKISTASWSNQTYKYDTLRFKKNSEKAKNKLEENVDYFDYFAGDISIYVFSATGNSELKLTPMDGGEELNYKVSAKNQANREIVVTDVFFEVELDKKKQLMKVELGKVPIKPIRELLLTVPLNDFGSQYVVVKPVVSYTDKDEICFTTPKTATVFSKPITSKQLDVYLVGDGPKRPEKSEKAKKKDASQS